MKQQLKCIEKFDIYKYPMFLKKVLQKFGTRLFDALLRGENIGPYAAVLKDENSEFEAKIRPLESGDIKNRCTDNCICLPDGWCWKIRARTDAAHGRRQRNFRRRGLVGKPLLSGICRDAQKIEFSCTKKGNLMLELSAFLSGQKPPRKGS